MPKIRVLVVDDAVVVRRIISQVLEADPQLELAGVAANGRIALQKIPQVNPDIVTLDVEMPELDGIATLRELRKLYPKLPVIMCSTLTAKGAVTTIEALSAGATDYITKPANVGSVVEGFERMRTEMVPKIKSICAHVLPADTVGHLKPPTAAAAAPVRPRPAVAAAVRRGPVEAVGIGTSTGGPNALQEFFTALPRLSEVPLFIVQHMPPMFTAMLAERLTKVGPNPVHEARDGMAVEAGHAYLAPGGYHMVAVREGMRVVVRLNTDAPENSCRPAVDPLFRSLAHLYGPQLLTVVMTGMGQDGLRGCEYARERGAQVVVQDEATSVVWGMPGYVHQAGLADATLPLAQLAPDIQRRVREGRRIAA